jgi:ribosomal protein RSM22 (predicted rRNA methylase)
MQLPEQLQYAIDRILENTPQTALRKARESLSQDYREGRSSPFSDEAKRLAYLGARMPATFAAIHKVLQNVSLKGTLLDLGAGPGTASWAAAELFPELTEITLIEKSLEAITLGKSLADQHPVLKKASWLHQSLGDPIPKADTAILSYVLGELNDPLSAAEKCWEAAPLLILIEPGTPKAFQVMRKVRQRLIDLKAHIISPCPHQLACPIQGNDWCHFAARVERTRLHRLLKEGSLGYEDEKFCYLIASKLPGTPFSNRITRHPLKQSGYVRLSLCTDQGKIEVKTISRKDKALYRQARGSEWGDILREDSEKT